MDDEHYRNYGANIHREEYSHLPEKHTFSNIEKHFDASWILRLFPLNLTDPKKIPGFKRLAGDTLNHRTKSNNLLPSRTKSDVSGLRNYSGLMSSLISISPHNLVCCWVIANSSPALLSTKKLTPISSRKRCASRRSMTSLVPPGG